MNPPAQSRTRIRRSERDKSLPASLSPSRVSRSTVLLYSYCAVVVILHASPFAICLAPNPYRNRRQVGISRHDTGARLQCPRNRQRRRQLRPNEGEMASSLAVFPREYYDEESGEFRDPSSNPPRDSTRKPSSSSSELLGRAEAFGSALAIVPAIRDWDRIQRARHFARDPVFHQWPPAIRLFHPFDVKSSSAFDVAQLVEDLDIEPFEITFDTWVLVPHVEAMQAKLERQISAPDVVDGTFHSRFKASEEESDREVRSMIEAEERKAAEKARWRNSGSVKDTSTPDVISGATNNATVTFLDSSAVDQPAGQTKRQDFSPKKSPAQTRDEQFRMIEDDFGGPCVLCLEPNEESKQLLMDFREMLRDGLNHNPYFSPSSCYSRRYVKDIDMGFRPLIAISKFDTFQSGMEVARRLKGLWGQPLTIRVNDLHVLSCKDDDEDDSSIAMEWNVNGADSHALATPAMEFATEPFGCNAKIMLVGQELKQDDAANKAMVGQLLEEGEAGGMDISSDYTILDDEEEGTSDLERWLNDDEDFDEGTQVIMGRTHFFTGDQRIYRGMPATSVMDTKDRAMGELGSVSGLARRRGPSNRSRSQWEDGEYGRRSRDFMPWGLKERTAKENFAGYKNNDDPKQQ